MNRKILLPIFCLLCLACAGLAQGQTATVTLKISPDAYMLSTVENGVLYVSTAGSTVYALNASTGSVMWTSVLGQLNGTTSAAYPMNDTIFIVSNGGLFSFNTTSSTPLGMSPLPSQGYWNMRPNGILTIFRAEQTSDSQTSTISNGITYSVTDAIVTAKDANNSILWSRELIQKCFAPALLAMNLPPSSTQGPASTPAAPTIAPTPTATPTPTANPLYSNAISPPTTAPTPTPSNNDLNTVVLAIAIVAIAVSVAAVGISLHKKPKTKEP